MIKSKIHVEKALDGKEVHFDVMLNTPISRLPRFCTYCGSNELTDGYLGAFDDENEIHCKNCGAHIHDCCSQPDYKDFKKFIKDTIEKIKCPQCGGNSWTDMCFEEENARGPAEEPNTMFSCNTKGCGIIIDIDGKLCK